MHSPLNRRSFLNTTVLSSAAIGLSVHSSANAAPGNLSARATPTEQARNEKYWRYVGSLYDQTEGIINLEHGYWGKMAKPVEEEYQQQGHWINQQLSYYARKQWTNDFKAVGQTVANALNVKPNEIALTRNATESLHSIINHYKGLQPGDAVLWADIDYPAFKQAMDWLAKKHQADTVVLDIPPRANQAELEAIYHAAFQNHPNLKLALLTHVSNQHGLKLPAKSIISQAKQAGIDVICDCAQSWGLVDFTLPELNADWALFNLHKWIGAPVGVGALYMKQGTLEKTGAFAGQSDPTNTNINARVHMATANFASFLTVPKALEFHQSVGGDYKEARLRYLRSIWVDAVKDNSNIEILGASDDASATGMGGFRLANKNSVEENIAVQKKLEHEFGLFTVVRKGLTSGANIRVTPQVYTHPDNMLALADALKTITK